MYIVERRRVSSGVCVCVYNVSALSIGKDSGSIFSALSYREKFVKE